MTDAVECACPRHGARDCYRVRYELDLREALGDSLSADEAEDECGCVCHREPENDDDA